MNDPGNPFSNANFSQLLATPFNNESLCAASSWLTEQAIDVAGGALDGTGHAHILYVGAQNCLNTGLFAAEQKVIDNHLADVVTNSWGDDAGDLLDDVATKTAYDDLFMLADSTGMTVQFSSGDNGDNFNLFGFSSRRLPGRQPVRHGGGRHVAQDRAKRPADRPARLGDRPVVQVHGQRRGRHSRAAPSPRWAPGCRCRLTAAAAGSPATTTLQPAYQKGVVPISLAQRNAAHPGPSLDAGDPGHLDGR